MIAVSDREFRRTAVQLCMKLCSSDGQLYIIWLVPVAFKSFQSMIYSRSFEGEVFDEGDAVASKPTAYVIFHLKATDKTQYPRFNAMVSKANGNKCLGEKLFVATGRHMCLRRQVTAQCKTPFVYHKRYQSFKIKYFSLQKKLSDLYYYTISPTLASADILL